MTFLNRMFGDCSTRIIHMVLRGVYHCFIELDLFAFQGDIGLKHIFREHIALKQEVTIDEDRKPVTLTE